MCDYLFFVASDTEETYRDPERFTHSESNVSRSMLGTPSFIEEEENEQDYEAQADDVVEKVWRIFLDNTSWSQEAKSVDGQDVVFSKTFPKWGKVFRLTVRRKKTLERRLLYSLLRVSFQPAVMNWSNSYTIVRKICPNGIQQSMIVE